MPHADQAKYQWSKPLELAKSSPIAPVCQQVPLRCLTRVSAAESSLVKGHQETEARGHQNLRHTRRALGDKGLPGAPGRHD